MKNAELKKVRRALGYTQAGVAGKLGIAGDYVNMIENGRRTPSLPLAKRMADLYGKTVDELFFAPEKDESKIN